MSGIFKDSVSSTIEEIGRADCYEGLMTSAGGEGLAPGALIFGYLSGVVMFVEAISGRENAVGVLEVAARHYRRKWGLQ